MNSFYHQDGDCFSYKIKPKMCCIVCVCASFIFQPINRGSWSPSISIKPTNISYIPAGPSGIMVRQYTLTYTLIKSTHTHMYIYAVFLYIIPSKRNKRRRRRSGLHVTKYNNLPSWTARIYEGMEVNGSMCQPLKVLHLIHHIYHN